MSTTATTLLESILALPESDRITIAEALLATLPADAFEAADDEALEQELLRRSEECDKSPETVMPWSEVKAKLMKSDSWPK